MKRAADAAANKARLCLLFRRTQHQVIHQTHEIVTLKIDFGQRRGRSKQFICIVVVVVFFLPRCFCLCQNPIYELDNFQVFELTKSK